MLDIEEIFRYRQVNKDRLVPYGFKKEKENYVFHTSMLDGQFEAIIKIDANGQMTEEVRDVLTQEKYVLFYQPYAIGNFVGKVREAYEAVLQNFADACFDRVVFKNELTQKVIAYIANTYHHELEFPWEKSPENAVVRHPENRKWYAVILRVSKQKLGLNDSGIIDILNVKNDPQVICQLVDGIHYFSSYHMHKKYWMSIPLDYTVAFEDICHWIDVSHQLTKKK